MRNKYIIASVLCISMLLLSACSIKYTPDSDFNEYGIGEIVSIYDSDGKNVLATFCVDGYVLTKEEYVSDMLVDYKDGAPVYERTTYPYTVEIKYTFKNENGYKKELDADNFVIDTYSSSKALIVSVDNESLVLAVNRDSSFALGFRYDEKGQINATIGIPIGYAYNTEILEDLNEQAEKSLDEAEEAALDVVRTVIIFTASLIAVGIVGLIIFFLVYSSRQKKKRAAAPPTPPFVPHQPHFAPPPFVQDFNNIPQEPAVLEPEQKGQEVNKPLNAELDESDNDREFFTK